MTEPHLCPRCPGVGLFVGEARGLHPRACGACGGVWLPPDEAARILRPLFTLGGLPGKPTGTVYLHLSAADGYERGERHVWQSDRSGNKLLSAVAALEMIEEYLETV